MHDSEGCHAMLRRAALYLLRGQNGYGGRHDNRRGRQHLLKAADAFGVAALCSKGRIHLPEGG